MASVNPGYVLEFMKKIQSYGLCVKWNNGKFRIVRHAEEGVKLTVARLVRGMEAGYWACGEEQEWWDIYHSAKQSPWQPEPMQEEAGDIPFLLSPNNEQAVACMLNPEWLEEEKPSIYGNNFHHALTDEELLADAERQLHTRQEQRWPSPYSEVIHDTAEWAQQAREDELFDMMDTLRELWQKQPKRRTRHEVSAQVIETEIVERRLGGFDEQVVTGMTRENREERKNGGLPHEQYHKIIIRERKEVRVEKHEEYVSMPQADIHVAHWTEPYAHERHISAEHRGFKQPIYRYNLKKQRRIKFPR